MGIVGTFIDQVCESHPQLMQAVLERPLAPLGQWLHWDEENGICGCLIGTTALAAGFTVQMKRYATFSVIDDPSDCSDGAIQHVASTTGLDRRFVWRVGQRVNHISGRLSGGIVGNKESDDRTVHLLRQRIARSLVIRQARDPKYVEAGERYLAGVA